MNALEFSVRKSVIFEKQESTQSQHILSSVVFLMFVSGLVFFLTEKFISINTIVSIRCSSATLIFRSVQDSLYLNANILPIK